MKSLVGSEDVGPGLDPNTLTLMVFLKICFQNFNLQDKFQHSERIQKFSTCIESRLKEK